MPVRTMFRALILVMAVTRVAALSVVQTSQKPKFEVVSVKPNRSGPRGDGSLGRRGNLFVATNMPLRALLYAAYLAGGSFQNYQLIGVPDWIDGPDRFDVQAKFSVDSTPVSIEQQELMVESLLEDRFHLKTHRETRELPVYNLVVAKSGKIRRSEDQTTPVLVDKPTVIRDPSVSLYRGAVKVTEGLTRAVWTQYTIIGSAVPISELVSRIETNTGRRVIDKTGLKGLVDFHLEFVPEVKMPGGREAPPPLESVDRGGPSIFDAVQDQLGLKLESAKAPLEVVVIDTIERPTEN
jgi:uncharacterized protein (TIGR03435 family)